MRFQTLQSVHHTRTICHLPQHSTFMLCYFLSVEDSLSGKAKQMKTMNVITQSHLHSLRIYVYLSQNVHT